ncbi:NAD(P)-dependent alcohol dehydrogenase [Kineococcus gynurae]|uniref:NAD(P)-dependent alcohol dehydrogenase n=1 Tax=Kineococcus gynurae TaxID=452979 RepID=A0ABV5LW67_9ACTN
MIPTSTRAAVLHAALDLRVETIPLREPGPGEVLLEMHSGGVCGSDMHYFADGRNGTNVLREPMVLGHEGAGVVLAAGPDVDLPVGSSVVVEPATPCGSCETCASGRYNVCPHGRCLGSPPTHGLFAQHLVIAADRLHELPAEIPTDIGAAIEPLAVAVWAVQRAEVRPGDTVLVTGAGPIGLLVLQVAKAVGAARVVVTDVNDHRLATARRLGADAVVNTREADIEAPGQGFDRLLECSGVVPALAAAIPGVRPAGRVTVVGQARPTVDGIPLGHLQRYEIDLVCAFRYAHAFPRAIELAASGQVDLRGILTTRFGLDRAADALRAPTSSPTEMKVLIDPRVVDDA